MSRKPKPTYQELQEKEEARIRELIERGRQLQEEVLALRDEMRNARGEETHALLDWLRRMINQGHARQELNQLWGKGTVEEAVKRIDALIGR